MRVQVGRDRTDDVAMTSKSFRNYSLTYCLYALQTSGRKGLKRNHRAGD